MKKELTVKDIREIILKHSGINWHDRAAKEIWLKHEIELQKKVIIIANLRYKESKKKEIVEQQKKEIEKLQAWKKEAISVSPPLQEIGKELGIGLGQLVHNKILPGIQNLKQEIERLKKKE